MKYSTSAFESDMKSLRDMLSSSSHKRSRSRSRGKMSGGAKGEEVRWFKLVSKNGF